jgi:hypothetical protein
MTMGDEQTYMSLLEDVHQVRGVPHGVNKEVEDCHSPLGVATSERASCKAVSGVAARMA